MATPTLQHLDSYRRETLLRTAAFLVRHRPPDEVDWPREIAHLFREVQVSLNDPPGIQRLKEQLDALLSERNTFEAQCSAQGVALPLCELRDKLHLPPPALLLMAATAIAHIDLAVTRLWQWLQPVTGASPRSLGTWLDIFSTTEPAWRLELLAQLQRHGPLRALRLVDIQEGSAPWLLRETSVPQRLVHALLGLPWQTPGQMLTRERPMHPSTIVLDAQEEERLRACAHNLPPHGRLVFSGEPGTGRTTRSHWLAAHMHREVVSIHPGGDPHTSPQVLAAGLVEAALGTTLAIVRMDALDPIDNAELQRGLTATLVELTGHLHAPVAFVAPPRLAPQLTRICGHAQEWPTPPMGVPLARRLWHTTLKALNATPAPGAIDDMVNSFEIKPGTLVEACRQATLAHHSNGPISAAELRQAVHHQVRVNLSNLAELHRTPLTWSDVILPDDTMVLPVPGGPEKRAESERP